MSSSSDICRTHFVKWKDRKNITIDWGCFVFFFSTFFIEHILPFIENEINSIK